MLKLKQAYGILVFLYAFAGPRSAIISQGPWVRYPVWQHTLVSASAFQEGQLSVTGESMCTKYWLTA